MEKKQYGEGGQAEEGVSNRRERSPGLNASHSSGRGALS